MTEEILCLKLIWSYIFDERRDVHHDSFHLWQSLQVGHLCPVKYSNILWGFIDTFFSSITLNTSTKRKRFWDILKGLLRNLKMTRWCVILLSVKFCVETDYTAAHLSQRCLISERLSWSNKQSWQIRRTAVQTNRTLFSICWSKSFLILVCCHENFCTLTLKYTSTFRY